MFPVSAQECCCALYRCALVSRTSSWTAVDIPVLCLLLVPDVVTCIVALQLTWLSC